MEATAYECFFDESDYQIKNINEMTLKQLVIYKKQLLDLDESKTLTKSQNEILKGKFKVNIWNEYPATLTNANEKEAKHDTKMRALEFKKFKEECFKINKIKFENSKDTIQEIETLEETLRNKSEEKYKIEHKEYLNAKCKCECGMETIRKNKSTHKKSKAHQIYEAKLAEAESMKQANMEIMKQKKLIASRANNGYHLDEAGKIIWPIDSEGNRYYLQDANGKNIYPKTKDGNDIWMKDAKGFTIIPQEGKCHLFN